MNLKLSTWKSTSTCKQNSWDWGKKDFEISKDDLQVTKQQKTKKKQKQAIEKNLKQTYFTKCLHFLETSDPGNHLEKT